MSSNLAHDAAPSPEGPRVSHIRLAKPQEGELLTYAAAGNGKRVLAFLLDLVLSTALAGLVTSLVNLLAGESGITSIITQWTILLFYWVMPVYDRGQTLGKMILGLQVQRYRSNKDLTLAQVLGRETIGRMFSGLPLAAGYITALSRSDRRGFHDMLFETKVVDIRQTA